MVGKLTPDDIITASRVPALMGLSPYKTPNELLKEAIDAAAGNPPSRLPQNEQMRLGDLLEGPILDEAAYRLDLDHVNVDITEAIHHPDLPLACSLDGRGDGTLVWEHDPANGIYVPQGGVVDTHGLGVLEAKNTSAAPEDAPAPHRGPWQLQAQMMCTDASWGAVCVLYRGSELRLFLYRQDPDMQARIEDAVHDFERRKRDVDWYPPLSSDDANVAWGRVDDGAPAMDLNGIEDGDHWTQVLINRREEKRALEAEIDEAETMLKEMLGNHEEGRVEVGGSTYYVKWPMRNYKAQPAKTTEAKPARQVRAKTLTVKEA
jgi:hypothetical protein